MYRQPFQFLMPDHESTYRSAVGTMLSILTLILMVSYSTYKLIDLIELNDYKIQEVKREKYFHNKVPLSQEQGFQVAAAITSYDESSESIEDVEIGTIKFYIKWWRDAESEEDGDDDDVWGFREVKTKPCNPERDFNDEDGSNS